MELGELLDRIDRIGPSVVDFGVVCLTHDKGLAEGAYSPHSIIGAEVDKAGGVVYVVFSSSDEDSVGLSLVELRDQLSALDVHRNTEVRLKAVLHQIDDYKIVVEGPIVGSAVHDTARMLGLFLWFKGFSGSL